MSELTRWFDARRSPFDLLERLFDGDRDAPGAIRVEEVVDGDSLLVRAELPGVDPEKDVDISVRNGSLLISAQRQERKEEKEKGGYRSEFRYGSFSRTLPLPEGATEQDIQATYTDGVLEVRVPVPEQKQSEHRKIEVKRTG
ncbi:Hsp20/alpha crystallin family protein [Sinomonas atrocyanea]|uniref:Hsp20/alpha crystallin family protein n=1 Tax=Sinomonas atrocyanea TaxID=37927 RepID=UPI003D960FD4